MNFYYKHLVPQDFDAASRLWIYQSNRSFSESESFQIRNILQNFVANWKSHGTAVKGFADLFFNQFIVLMADECATGVSGCSTDSSVRMIKQIEGELKVDLFNRQMLAFIVNDDIELVPISEFRNDILSGSLHTDTLYFDNLVSTKKEFEQHWIIPIKQSWLKAKLPSVQIS